jgi:fido (protein-threonine AMPylation protein)
LSPRGRPSRQSVLADLDRAKAGLAGVGGLPKPEEAQAIWSGIWHEETHHSTAIEGNTMVLSQVKALLDEGLAVGNKELAEYLEIQAYGAAAQWVYSQAVNASDWAGGDGVNLTELRHIHELVVGPVWQFFPPPGHQPEEGPGAFRRHDVQPLASGHTPPSWTDVPARVNNWLEYANRRPEGEVHPLMHLADVHAEFEQIHPFLDGNGRTGRLLLNLMLVRSGYAPAIIYKRDRTKYLKALRRADRDRDPSTLAELLARAVKHSIDRFILPGLAGPHKTVPLGALATAKLSALALRRAAERGRLQAAKRGDQWVSTKQWVEEYSRSRKRGPRRASNVPGRSG